MLRNYRDSALAYLFIGYASSEYIELLLMIEILRDSLKKTSPLYMFKSLVVAVLTIFIS